LREKRKEAKIALGSTCFICSLDREAFQQKAKDFTTHTEKVKKRKIKTKSACGRRKLKTVSRSFFSSILLRIFL
jgi:hypothetical protein